MYYITKLLLTALLLLIVTDIIPGVQVDSVYHALIAAFILGLLNAIVRPVLILLTLPITIVTLGLFAFVINALLFMFAASFLEGFSVSGFWPALFGSLLVSVGGTIGDRFIKAK